MGRHIVALRRYFSVKAHSMVTFEDGTFEIDAVIIAEGLVIDASFVQQRMRDGTVKSRCERGTDSDEGRYRLTFFTERRRLRLIVDEAGNVLQRSTIDFGEHCAKRPAGRHIR